MKNSRKTAMRRASSGVNYFTGQMKFQNIGSHDTTPEQLSVEAKSVEQVTEHEDEFDSGSDMSFKQKKVSEKSVEKTLIQKEGIKIGTKLNVSVDKINMRNIGEALTGYVQEVNEQMIHQENENLVRQGYIGFDKYIDVHSPKGEKKIRVRFPQHKTIKIKSDLVKRMELEHIEETMESLAILPDFGYPTMLLDAEFKGWEHFSDLI